MKKIIITAGLLFVTLFSNAQSVEEELKADVIEIKDGKFICDDLTMVTLKGENYQISIHTEASSNGFISRDNFIYFPSMLANETISGLTSGDESATSEDLEEITGKADIAINCYMSKVGMQIETTTKDGIEKNTHKWADLL
jgi:hypothetical protein